MKNATKEKKHRLILMSLNFFLAEIFILIKSPVFALLTILGNVMIGTFSLAFYFFELNHNVKIHSYLDALWWGMATATTTGYGDITPVTIQGKVLGIILMLTGMALFAMFTALFAKTILNSSTYYRHED
ncbi:potassium channel family protein [Bacteriovorax sp. PP10]|uniref:Potassium channel family protein n=1 Tax=Bacteriovorax antarcticus TaxID=3088717 RepID=A0ABU5VZQ2_9BACT|nr:potassium channel family protein [Bacteriovorax sp. PP10]MEA9357848.1 potassium channel family protein [Bacteriovorax sp. PP10]